MVDYTINNLINSYNFSTRFLCDNIILRNCFDFSIKEDSIHMAKHNR